MRSSKASSSSSSSSSVDLAFSRETQFQSLCKWETIQRKFTTNFAFANFWASWPSPLSTRMIEDELWKYKYHGVILFKVTCRKGGRNAFGILCHMHWPHPTSSAEIWLAIGITLIPERLKFHFFKRQNCKSRLSHWIIHGTKAILWCHSRESKAVLHTETYTVFRKIMHIGKIQF